MDHFTEAQQIEQRVWLALAPDSLPTLMLSQLREHHDSLCEARQVRLRWGYTTDWTMG